MGDLGFAVRSVGISLGPGLVDFVDGPSLSADPPDLAAKQLMIGYLKNNEAKGRERKDKGLRRTRAARRQVRGDAESLSSFAMSLQSI